MPSKQPKRGRLWLNDGSCVRLRPQRKDHVWAYDIVRDRTHDGRALRILTLVDEYPRECLAIDLGRRMNSEDVLERLTDLFIRRGVPDHIRSDNGAEFTANAVWTWLARMEVRTLFIEPARGRTVTSSRSTASCGMNCSTARSSIHCGRPKCSSNAGASTTTTSDRTARWATGRRHRR